MDAVATTRHGTREFYELVVQSHEMVLALDTLERN
jgi:hypothetical protein